LERLGSGVSSVVFRAKTLDSGEEVAVKVIRPGITHLLPSLTWKDTYKVLSTCLPHDRIVKVIEHFNEGDDLYIVVEKLPGTAVSILREGKLTEWTQKDACRLSLQLLEAVQQVHSKGYTHCDISASNILATDDKVSGIKLAGFTKVISGETDNDLFCEANFKAPEVVERKKHTQSVDLWATGCLAFLFLTGKLPFKDTNTVRLNNNTTKGNYTMEDADWSGIDSKAVDLVKGLLTIDPSARLTAKQALESEWIKGGGSSAAIPNFFKNLTETYK